ncbi:uncharacterized protein LOC135384836 [Ornithodoros turicata]
MDVSQGRVSSPSSSPECCPYSIVPVQDQVASLFGVPLLLHRRRHPSFTLDLLKICRSSAALTHCLSALRHRDLSLAIWAPNRSYAVPERYCFYKTALFLEHVIPRRQRSALIAHADCWRRSRGRCGALKEEELEHHVVEMLRVIKGGQPACGPRVNPGLLETTVADENTQQGMARVELIVFAVLMAGSLVLLTNEALAKASPEEMVGMVEALRFLEQLDKYYSQMARPRFGRSVPTSFRRRPSIMSPGEDDRER